MSFFSPSHLCDLLFGVLMRVVYIQPHISFKCLQRPRKSPARGRRMKMKSSHVDLPQLPLLCATLVIRVYTERVSTKHCMIFLLFLVANYVRRLVDIRECEMMIVPFFIYGVILGYFLNWAIHFEHPVQHMEVCDVTLIF